MARILCRLCRGLWTWNTSSRCITDSGTGGAWRLHGFRRSRVAGPACFWGFSVAKRVKSDASKSVNTGNLLDTCSNLNVHLEHWNRSVKEECLSKLIFFGEASLPHVLSNYAHHFHNERNHQGKANVILFPAPADRVGESSGEIRTRERLGGLLKFYHREAV